MGGHFKGSDSVFCGFDVAKGAEGATPEEASVAEASGGSQPCKDGGALEEIVDDFIDDGAEHFVDESLFLCGHRAAPLVAEDVASGDCVVVDRWFQGHASFPRLVDS